MNGTNNITEGSIGWMNGTNNITEGSSGWMNGTNNITEGSIRLLDGANRNSYEKIYNTDDGGPKSGGGEHCEGILQLIDRLEEITERIVSG